LPFETGALTLHDGANLLQLQLDGRIGHAK
jgi:hypothetical protein